MDPKRQQVPKNRTAPGNSLPFVLAGLLAGFGHATAGVAESYQLTDIDQRLSAALTAQFGVVSQASKALDVSDRGEVVGYVEFVRAPLGVLRWPFSYNAETDVVVLFGSFLDGSLVLSGEFRGVNEGGLCVGRAAKLTTLRDEAVVSSASTGRLLPLRTTAPSRAADINESDWVVGTQSAGVISQQSFLIADDGTLTPVSVAPFNSEATALNDEGLLVGYAESRAGLVGFVAERQGAEFTALTLGSLGGTVTIPQAINSQGLIVGESATGTGRHAFLTHPTWNGALQDLGTLGGNESHALDLNDDNLVVGSAAPLGSPVLSAFALDLNAGQPAMVDLNSRLPEAEQQIWHLGEANAVNAVGWIAASGTRAPDSRFPRAVLLQPEPPPPGQVTITILGLQTSTNSFTMTWATTPPGAPIDLYRTTNLLSWGEAVSTANTTGSFTDTSPPVGKGFYALVPTGAPSP